MARFSSTGWLRLCAAAWALVWCSAAYAWGPTGHRISGAIAEQYLQAATRVQIERVLGNESLITASTWADEMRGNPAHFWQEVAGPWHYVTVPDGKRYQDVGAPRKGDAVYALKRFQKILLDPNASLESQQLALRFSVHIIADLQQPFHVGNGKDRGGNKLRVRFRGKTTNLHSLWDSKLIKTQELSLREWTAALDAALDPAQARAWASPDPLLWVAESAAIRRGIYPQGGTIGQDYVDKHLPTVRLRLMQSGVRIAAYLNEVYSE